jgi:hypothetical protein
VRAGRHNDPQNLGLTQNVRAPGFEPTARWSSLRGADHHAAQQKRVSTTFFFLFFKKNIFVADALISPFNTQTTHIKSFYTQQHGYVSLITLYPGGIRTRVFLFLRRMRCPLRHAARAFLSHFLGSAKRNSWTIPLASPLSKKKNFQISLQLCIDTSKAASLLLPKLVSAA